MAIPTSLHPSAVLIDLYRRVIGSLWFVPALHILGGVALGFLAVLVGPRLPLSALDFLPVVDGDSVKDLLRLLASSTLTIATVTFSILMVVLTMTASNFSPRALSGYMRDPVNQYTLGAFLGGFAFGITGLLLSRFEDDEPQLLGLLVVVTVLVSLIVLAWFVYFIHHTASAVQITSLVVRLHGEAERALADYLSRAEEGNRQVPPLPSDPPAHVSSEKAGYVQVLDRDALRSAAIEHSLMIQVLRDPGAFVARGAPLVAFWPAARDGEHVTRAVRAAYAIGAQRTAEGDPLLGVELLAEVGLRALSPGINDPNTAANCLHYLGDLLMRLAGRTLPAPVQCTDSGAVCVVEPAPEFRAFVERALLGIAAAGAGHAVVVLSLMTVIAEMARAEPDTVRRAYLRDIAAAIADRALEALPFEVERERLRAARHTVAELCEDAAPERLRRFGA